MGLLDLFKKTPEELALERKIAYEEEQKIQEAKAEEQRIYEALKTIIFFPGSKKEFEDFVGYECFVIDNGQRDKGLLTHFDPRNAFTKYDSDLRKKLVNDGIVGLINTITTNFHVAQTTDNYGRYGLPVGRKK